MEHAIYIIIGAIIGSIGSIVLAIVNYFLNQKKEQILQYNQIMEEKYKSMLIFMICALDFDKRKHFNVPENAQYKSSGDYLNKLKEYYYHSLLYCPDEVLKFLKCFIEDPCRRRYIQTAQAMRKSLWKRKSKLTYENIFLL